MEKRVAAYLRVSTQDQVGGMESQERVLRQYCQHNSIENVEFFSDHGISGTKSNRPSLDRMMAAVDNGEISTVVVYSFSRFARSTTHLLNALQIFKKKGVQFVITEALDTNSPMGLALFTILGALAQMEREIIRNRVIAGLKNARAKGKHIGRVRKRNDVLIHSLLDAQLSFREIARIAKCSHGSVSAAKKEWLAKKASLKAKELEASETSSTNEATTATETQASTDRTIAPSQAVDTVAIPNPLTTPT